MCSGRIDLEFILRAFSNGVDGVFIGGCRLNECNYITHGNYHALNLALLGKKIMAHIGLNPDRLRIEFMSAGEGIHFAETVDGFVRTVRDLGPLGQGEGVDPGELSSQLETVTKLVPYIKIVKGEKLASRLESEDAYEEYFTGEEIESLLRDVVSYHIDPEKCRACMICLRKCPVDAITGGKNRIHVIDQDQCIKCGTCFEVCPARFAAVDKISGEPVPPPIPEAQRDIVRK
jgi:F420-non-reducing hydrogenase iron-sulfur subunit